MSNRNAALPDSGRGHEIVVDGAFIEGVLDDYALRVTDSQGKSFATMADELEGEIDCESIEEAARAAGTENGHSVAYEGVRKALVNLGVLEF